MDATDPSNASHLDQLMALLGEPPWRSRAERAADTDAWEQLEHRLGARLPDDFKRFADLYAPCVLQQLLFIPHPRRGARPLLAELINGTAEVVSTAREHLPVFPPAPPDGLPDLVAWGHHNWDGDLCFFAPESTDPATWTIGVLCRQPPGYFIYAGSFTAFIHGLLTETLNPADHPGWVTTEPLWSPVEPWR